MGDAVSDSRNFADILLREGLITRDQHEQGQKEFQSGSGERSLPRIFVEMGVISEGVKIGILQKKLDCQVINLKDVVPTAEATKHLPRAICEKHHVAPVRVENGRLVVAMEDPTDARAVSAIEAAVGMPIRTFLAKSSEIADAIRQLPIGGPEVQRGPGGRRIAGLVSITLLCGVPILAFVLLLIYHKPFQAFYRELQLEPFERVLFFVLSWSAWAIVAYWINDIIFGEKDPDDV